MISYADRPLPPGPHGVVIALGGRAARRARQAGAPTVASLAPALSVPVTVHIAMTPSPERIVSLLAAAGIRRLLVIRAAPAETEFVRRAAAAGKRSEVVLEEMILKRRKDFPRLLRAMGTRADAIWLAPDPGAVTPETFAVAREFARARAVPFFAPATGLVSGEIRGELVVSFHDCGKEAARVARELLGGRSAPKVVYPDP